jgi:hypothetical protein
MRTSILFRGGLALTLTLGLARMAAHAGDLPYEPAGPGLMTGPYPDAAVEYTPTNGFSYSTAAPNPACWAPATPPIKDQMWVQVLGGALFSPTRGLGPHDVPRINFTPVDVRVGVLIDCLTCETGCCRGGTEFILDLTVDPVIKGPGSILGGPSALLRYNFVQEKSRLIPYIQGGGGIVFNDIYKDKTQRAVGQAEEFLLQAGIGLHYLVRPNLSIDAEADFAHVSNAGMSRRNAGLNATGGMIGITYYFHKLRHF